MFLGSAVISATFEGWPDVLNHGSQAVGEAVSLMGQMGRADVFLKFGEGIWKNSDMCTRKV